MVNTNKQRIRNKLYRTCGKFLDAIKESKNDESTDDEDWSGCIKYFDNNFYEIVKIPSKSKKVN